MLAGLIAFARMQVNNAPDIDFPAAIVSGQPAWRRPNEMETQVTQRIESAIRGVTGVEEISSTVSEGNSTTFVQFVLGTPTDRAVNDVRNVVSQIRSNLPDGILEPQVTRVDAEDEPIMVMARQTTDMTLEQLSWYIDNTVAKRLLGVEGIAAVSRGGGVTDHPGDPRSCRTADPGHHRRAGQSAAAPKQHQRRRRPGRGRRLGAVGARAWQCARRL
jgi:multidrug efflux pump subunit AcrB